MEQHHNPHAAETHSWQMHAMWVSCACHCTTSFLEWSGSV